MFSFDKDTFVIYLSLSFHKWLLVIFVLAPTVNPWYYVYRETSTMEKCLRKPPQITALRLSTVVPSNTITSLSYLVELYGADGVERFAKSLTVPLIFLQSQTAETAQMEAWVEKEGNILVNTDKTFWHSNESSRGVAMVKGGTLGRLLTRVTINWLEKGWKLWWKSDC